MVTLLAMSIESALNVIGPLIVPLPMRLAKAPPEFADLIPLPPNPAVPVMLTVPAPVASILPPWVDAASESSRTP
jgi:hypothetical protein